MMTERRATLAMEALDKDCHAVGMSVRQIIDLLHDYIPRSCLHEAENKLFDTFFINDVELTTNTMRKEYEEWKKLELKETMLQPNPFVVSKS